MRSSRGGVDLRSIPSSVSSSLEESELSEDDDEMTEIVILLFPLADFWPIRFEVDLLGVSRFRVDFVEVGRGRGEGTEGFVGDLERERVEREEGAGFGIEDLTRPV